MEASQRPRSASCGHLGLLLTLCDYSLFVLDASIISLTPCLSGASALFSLQSPSCVALPSAPCRLPLPTLLHQRRRSLSASRPRADRSELLSLLYHAVRSHSRPIASSGKKEFLSALPFDGASASAELIAQAAELEARCCCLIATERIVSRVITALHPLHPLHSFRQQREHFRLAVLSLEWSS